VAVALWLAPYDERISHYTPCISFSLYLKNVRR
jgi:hypothetical protein